MSLGWLSALYALVGLICAAVVYERAPRPGARALGEALITLLLWPLWAPFALVPPTRGDRR